MRKLIGLAARARSGKDTVANLINSEAQVVCYALADPVKVGCQVLFGLSDKETWDDSVKEDRIALWARSPREFFQLTGTEWMRAHNPDHWLLRAERAMDTSFNPGHVESAPNLNDPKAVFKLAAQAFFGLSAHQTWSPEELDIIDPLWNASPKQTFDLIEQLALKSFPDFIPRRAERLVLPPTRSVPMIELGSAVVIKDIRYENEADFIRKKGGQIWHLIRESARKVNPHSSEQGIEIKRCDVVINNNGTLTELSDTVRSQCKSAF